jgi:hypothetical protein
MDPVMAMRTDENLPAGTTPGDGEGPHRWVGAFVSERWGQLKLSPQAQELPALGLSIVKPCFSIVSAKSMVAPVR